MEDDIVRAIYAFTAHVRQYEDTLVRDTAAVLTVEEEQERVEAKRAVCDEMEAFAERSRTERTTFQEFEGIRHKNHDVFIAGVPTEVLSAIAAAFHALGRLDR